MNFRKRGVIHLGNSGMHVALIKALSRYVLTFIIEKQPSKLQHTHGDGKIPKGVFDGSDDEYDEAIPSTSLETVTRANRTRVERHSNHGQPALSSSEYNQDMIIEEPFDQEPREQRNAIGMIIRDDEDEDDEDDEEGDDEEETELSEDVVSDLDQQTQLHEEAGGEKGVTEGSYREAPLPAESTINYQIAEEPFSRPVDVPDFHVALMVFATTADLSLKQYQVLREVLQLASIETIKSLPASLQTLKTRCKKNMPIQKIRAYPIQVQLPKLPPKSTSPGTAYRFEVLENCQRWLANPEIYRNMHFGLGIITNNRKEFYHGNAWLASVRTTSGEFLRLKNSDGRKSHPLQATNESDGRKSHPLQATNSDGRKSHPLQATDSDDQELVLLPSDCVTFLDSHGEKQFGRIYGVGTTETTGSRVALIQRLLPVSALPPNWGLHWMELVEQAVQQATKVSPAAVKPWAEATGDLPLPELVLMEDDKLAVPVDLILRKEYIHLLDYTEPPKDLLPQSPTHCVRYIAYHRAEHQVRLIDQRHRIPAERELCFYGRQYVFDTFVLGTKRKISIPLCMFLDAFGLHRNAYCSIEGMYMTPACLNEGARTKLQNWFVLMYGPFGAQVQDMLRILDDEFPALERGLTVNLAGEEVLLTCFPLCITGDMPQQNANAGIKSHKSIRGCRYCLVSDDERIDLKYSVEVHGRYSQLSAAINDHRQSLKKGKSAELLNKYGMLEHGSYFAITFPLLDPYTCFPIDAMHCELRLAKYFHEALKEEILTTAGTDAYSAAWNTMNPPYGW
jgi:hypothetical protein